MCPGVHIMTSWKARDSIQLSRGDSHSWWVRGGCGKVRNCFRVLVETKSILNFPIFPLRYERIICLYFLIHIYLFNYLWRQWVSHFVAQVGFKLKEILFQPSQYRVIGVSHHTGFTLLCSTLFSNFPPLAKSLMFSYSCIVAILNCFQRIRFCFQLRFPGTIIWSKICY